MTIADDNFDDNCWWQFFMKILYDNFWWQLLMTIVDDNFWWQFLKTIIDDNFWWQFLMTICDENFWWKFLMTIFDDKFWWQFVWTYFQLVTCDISSINIYLGHDTWNAQYKWSTRHKCCQASHISMVLAKALESQDKTAQGRTVPHDL